MEFVRSRLRPWTGSRPGSRSTSPAPEPTARVNPLTYPQSSRPFNSDLFKNPTSEYRGCPFWAWNTKLKKEQLLRQIDDFAAMGMGGFHMHVRTGLDTEYLGDEFMDIVRACVLYAEEKGLLACLYDEDRWPSGAAGGLLTNKYPEYKAKHILFTPRPYGTVHLGEGCMPSSGRACRSENGHLLATYAVELDQQGRLRHTRRVKEDEEIENGTKWYAYVETNPPSPWYNGQTYIDTMNYAAIRQFIDITHDAYKRKVGDRFGSTIPCIFTDEPQTATKTQLSSPNALEDVFLPWTDSLDETYKQRYGTTSDLVRDIPQLVWDLPGSDPSVARYRYHDHVCDRFVTAFMDQLSGWCRSNNLLLNGHMMEEPTLRSQTTALGEAMRCYRRMGMPGMDLLSDAVEYNTAKQVTSVARQNGLRGAMSEIYGCTHWYFTFEGHKGCGDWQAALGITFRVHHLTWVSMAGEGKRDYPASIGYQSPWYKEYGYIEDHFSRVGVAMTRGKPITRVGVIHPIESFWLYFGPNGGDNDEMQKRDEDFEFLTEWLLHGLVDFDFISESLLPNQYTVSNDGKLHVGACQYEVIILPNLRTIRSSTLRILSEFASSGGKLIITGDEPKLVDGYIISSDFSAYASATKSAKFVPWSQETVLSSLDEHRDIIVTDGKRTVTEFLYQMRQDGDQRYVFLCNTDRENGMTATIYFTGLWDVELLDTLTGEISRLPAETRKAGQWHWTILESYFNGCDSALFRLTPAKVLTPPLKQLEIPRHFIRGPFLETNPVELKLDAIELSEPNVLMLDYGKYRVNGGPWSDVTEILTLENEVRGQLHLPLKGTAWRQPWTVPKSERGPKAEVIMNMKFESEIDIPGKYFNAAVEIPTETRDVQDSSTQKPFRFWLNDAEISVASSTESWWVDESIVLIEAGIPIKAGVNEIWFGGEFEPLANFERVYVLGDFKVDVKDGLQPAKLKPWSPITFGDITKQGMPFYVGNIIYKLSYALEKNSRVTLDVGEFASPVLAVTGSHGKGKQYIALQPHKLDLGVVKAGRHTLEITAFGNRYNAFGHIHMAQDTGRCWPDAWRTRGKDWTDEYKVKPMGILGQPRLYTEPVEDDELATYETASRSSTDWVVVCSEDHNDQAHV